MTRSTCRHSTESSQPAFPHLRAHQAPKRRLEQVPRTSALIRNGKHFKLSSRCMHSLGQCHRQAQNRGPAKSQHLVCNTLNQLIPSSLGTRPLSGYQCLFYQALPLCGFTVPGSLLWCHAMARVIVICFNEHVMQDCR